MYGLLVVIYLFIALLALVSITGLWIAILAYHRVRDLRELYDEDQALWESGVPK